MITSNEFIKSFKLNGICSWKKTSKLYVSSANKKLGMLDFPDEHEPKPICDSIQGEYRRAAVVSNTEFCSSVGREILEKGGSAVDALIATMLCEGLCAMQNAGIGGGFFMTFYSKEKREAICLDAREAAPMSASKDMFNGEYQRSATGNLSIAVPGELMGYWEAHKKFGKLPWRDLFQPAINMCLQGIPVNKRLGKAFSESGMGPEILASPSLRNILAAHGKLPVVGDTIRIPALANTLESIANSPIGAMEFYRGSITSAFIGDLKKLGSIITAEDLYSYRALWKKPVETNLSDGHRVFTTPPPASGYILTLILKLLDGLLEADPATNIIMVAEAFKHAYAVRSMLGDPQHVDLSEVCGKLQSDKFINELRKKIKFVKKTENNPKHYGAQFDSCRDRGTINIVVLAPNGDAAVATSTINTLFGSLLASETTGIILNNEMDDFSAPQIINSFNLPPCPANFICGSKRPMSSSCPTVIVDLQGNVRLAVGAAGGSFITTSTAQVIMNNLWFGVSIKDAVDMPRIHHQLYPMVLRYEEGIPTEVLNKAQQVGHKLKKRGPSSSVTAVAQNNGSITAIYDYRRGGSTAGF